MYFQTHPIAESSRAGQSGAMLVSRAAFKNKLQIQKTIVLGWRATATVMWQLLRVTCLNFKDFLP